MCAAAVLALIAAAATDLALLAHRHSVPTLSATPRQPLHRPDPSPKTQRAAPIGPVVDQSLAPHPSPAIAANDLRPVVRQSLAPDSIAIPRQHVTAPVGICDIVDNALEPPADVHQTCRWAGGAGMLTAPTGIGSQGTTAITGHINWVGQGTGTLGRLAELRPGDIVLTSDDTGAVTRWRITSVALRNKSRGVDLDAFAGPSGPRILYLISCGGAFDSAELSYVDNVYVRAIPDFSAQTHA
jgi:hypothetical protein